MTAPGLHPRRLVRLMRAAIARCDLRLDNLTVLTEAATGAWAVTPVLAAMAGAAKVCAVGCDSGFQETEALAGAAGVRIEFVDRKTEAAVRAADIITNSGYVRPLDRETVGWMRPGAAIPLMYEAWERRPEDVDLAACRANSIRVAGTNECHPAVAVFPYLGVMAVKLLLDAGIAVHGSRVMVLADNAFRPYLVNGLEAAGAEIAATELDAVLVAQRGADLAPIVRESPGAVVAQFWGDIDRDALARLGVPFWPIEAPAPGHMGVLPSEVGPEPVIRLQAGGLKVGQLLVEAGVEAAVASGFGQAVMA